MTIKNLKRNFLPLLLTLSACSSAPNSKFFLDLLGNYTLNATGAEFFTLQIPGSTIPQGAVFTVNNAGDWIFNKETYLTAVEARNSTQAVYRFNRSGAFFAMAIFSRTTILVSTNTVSRPEDVDFAFLVPIAIKK